MNQPTQLIQACIAGDRHSQNLLYNQYAGKMLGVCLRYAKNKQEAEEIVQEGFVQTFKSLKSFRQEGSLEGWIRKIMVHCAIQYYRSKPKMHLVVNLEPVNTEDLAAESIISQLSKKELLNMVQALPPACRMVFNLHVFEGMKHREIADLLDISEGTSKSNLYDAKIILQRAVTNSLKIAMQNF
jgi:RNA polymerase sigma factor (sigma-70 family)